MSGDLYQELLDAAWGLRCCLEKAYDEDWKGADSHPVAQEFRAAMETFDAVVAHAKTQLRQ